jgi:hypothetical protein
MTGCRFAFSSKNQSGIRWIAGPWDYIAVLAKISCLFSANLQTANSALNSDGRTVHTYTGAEKKKNLTYLYIRTYSIGM